MEAITEGSRVIRDASEQIYLCVSAELMKTSFTSKMKVVSNVMF